MCIPACSIVVAFVLDAFVSKYDKQMEEADKYSNPVAVCQTVPNHAFLPTLSLTLSLSDIA